MMPDTTSDRASTEQIDALAGIVCFFDAIYGVKNTGRFHAYKLTIAQFQFFRLRPLSKLGKQLQVYDFAKLSTLDMASAKFIKVKLTSLSLINRCWARPYLSMP